MNNTASSEKMGDYVQLPNPHWTTLVLNVAVLFHCTILGSTSSCSALYQILSRRNVRSSHWFTVVLLMTTVYACIIVAPLEIVQVILHYFDTAIPTICDLQLFSLLLCGHLVFVSSIIIAVGRVRRIHNPFQINPRDVFGCLLMGISMCVNMPIIILLCYSAHINVDLYFTYKFCMKHGTQTAPPSEITGFQTFLSVFFPAFFFLVLTTLVCVYMKGVWRMKKRISQVLTSGSSPYIGEGMHSQVSFHSTPVQRISYLPRESTHCSMNGPMFPGSDCRSSVISSATSRDTNREKMLSRKNSMLQTTIPSTLSCSQSLPSATSESPKSKSSIRQPSESSMTNIENDKLHKRREPRCIQGGKKSGTESRKQSPHTLHKALKKVSTVSMLSIDRIPEEVHSRQDSDEYPLQMLQPLRHTRRSAGNVWHTDTIEKPKSIRSSSSLEKVSGKKRKKQKKRVSELDESIANQSYQHCLESHPSQQDTRGIREEQQLQSNQSISHLPQKYNRKRSEQENRLSITSMISFFTSDGEELGKFDARRTSPKISPQFLIDESDISIPSLDMKEMTGRTSRGELAKLKVQSTPLPVPSQNEDFPTSHRSGAKTAGSSPTLPLRKKVRLSTDTWSLPALGTNVSHDQKNLTMLEGGQESRRTTSLTLSDSTGLRQPLPAITSTVREKFESGNLPTKESQESERIRMNNFIGTWGRLYPSEQDRRRIQSLGDLHSTSLFIFGTNSVTPLELGSQKIQNDATTQTEDDDIFHETEDTVSDLGVLQVTQVEPPEIRIIRPSLPDKNQHPKPQWGNRRRVLHDNWCRTNQSTPTRSISPESFNLRWRNVSRFSMNSNRTNMSRSLLSLKTHRDIKNLLSRSLLLIGAFLVCYLPKILIHMCSYAMSESLLVNIYPSALTMECLYFTIIPLLYVYTNVSLMKLMKKKACTCKTICKLFSKSSEPTCT